MRYLLITALGLFVFAACKKVETPESREEQMRTGRWKRSDLKIKIDPYIGKDTLWPYYDSVMIDCFKDNYVIFGINHDGTVYSGENRCDNIPDPETSPFYWSLEENKTRITLLNANSLFFDSSTIDAKIDAFNTSQFKISYVEYHKNGINTSKKDTFTYYYTFTKF